MRSVGPLSHTLSVLPAKLETLYPPELEIHIKSGMVTTNVPEPYFIPMKDVENVLKDNTVLGTNSRQTVNLLVIDTKASIDDFERYQSAVLITKNDMVVAKDDNKYEVYPLRDWPDMVINRKQAVQMINTVKPLLTWVIPIVLVAVFLGFSLFFPSFLTTMLLWYAFAVWIVAKILSYPLGYKKSYQLAMHIILIPVTFVALLGVIPVIIPVPFFHTIVTVLLAGYILTGLKKQQTKPATVR